MAKNETYEEFVEKFKPKRTTDDCFTPPEVYEVIKNYVCQRYEVDPERIIRPFWPGADYKTFEYPEGCVVLDNPPFSILAQICRFYLERDIPFFLFAPTLSLLSANALECNHLVCDGDIVYENGARISTSFITSFGYPIVFETDPDLTKLINDKVAELRKERTKKPPRYVYPDNVITAAIAGKYALRGIRFSVTKDEARFIRRLDSQMAHKAAIYGGGLLLSESKAAERAAAERAAAERAAAERAAAERAAANAWKLSEREKAIVKELSE